MMYYNIIITVSPSGDLLCQVQTPDNCDTVIQCRYNNSFLPDVILNGRLLSSDCTNIGGNCELHNQIREANISSLIVLLNSSSFDCNKEYVLVVGWSLTIVQPGQCTKRVINIAISG